MADILPASLSRLFEASEEKRDDAWTAFLEAYSERILKTARSLGGDDDAVMDRYVFVLEELARNDFGRLREYTADRRAKFSTWLAIVARRLCIDHHRKVYGRAPATGSNPRSNPTARRRLVDLVGSELALETLPAPRSDRPDRRLEGAERREALQAAVAGRAPDERLLLALRFEEELTAREIAELMHLPTPFHVYRRLNKVLEKLRNELQRRGITP